MKFLYLIAALLSCWVLSAQQDLRISYAYLSKADTSDLRFKAQMDMKLDVSGNEAVFYSEEMFLADSLSVLAFWNNGEIKDQAAYDERRKHSSANSDMYHVDYSTSDYQSFIRMIGNAFMGEGKLDLPPWELVDSTRTFGGYTCKKAQAFYLGRTWNVWYTEEIPLNAGPWLLWGCPGLIIHATDSEELFSFYILNVEYISKSRWPDIEKNFLRKAKGSRLPIKDLEAVRIRSHRDMDYMRQLMGVSSSVVRDRNGNIVQENRYRKYQPLTSEFYWK